MVFLYWVMLNSGLAFAIKREKREKETEKDAFMHMTCSPGEDANLEWKLIAFYFVA